MKPWKSVLAGQILPASMLVNVQAILAVDI
jgi:hypothetical protein